MSRMPTVYRLALAFAILPGLLPVVSDARAQIRSAAMAAIDHESRVWPLHAQTDCLP